MNEWQKLAGLFSGSDKVKVLLLLFMMIVAAMLEVVGIGMVPAFVAIVADPQKLFGHPIAASIIERYALNSGTNLMLHGALLLILVFVVKNIYILFFRYWESRFIYNRRYAFSLRLMSAYMYAPYTFFLARNTSELLRNLTGEVNLLINSVLTPLLKVAKEFIMMAFVLAFLLVLEPVITLVVLIFMGGITGLFLGITQRIMRRFGIQAQNHRKEMLKSARQGFGGIKEARLMNREKWLINDFRKPAFETSRLQMLKKFISDIPRPTIETIAIGGILGIGLIMFHQQRTVSDIVPVIALFGVATVRLMPAIQQMTQAMTELKYNLASVNPIYDDLLALKPYQQEMKSDRRISSKLLFHNKIEIKDVSFSYPNSNKHVLHEINLSIKKGQAVAFVGPSGAGKTTLADILLGLLEPDQGTIYVDGKDILGCISSWQRNIGYIPQFIYLTDDSIRNNVAFALDENDISDSLVWRALELAQLADFVKELPDGIHSIIGERGTRLSGGQRQRIGIARALYHDPQILVMDEATSSLDSLTENNIIQAIENLKGQRTIIMIAHRLSTVKNCDVLFYMQNGRITAWGSYLHLYQTNADFHSIADMNT